MCHVSTHRKLVVEDKVVVTAEAHVSTLAHTRSIRQFIHHKNQKLRYIEQRRVETRVLLNVTIPVFPPTAHLTHT